ncbi:hypothetical protein EE612_053741, partial [Oryza sativa]
MAAEEAVEHLEPLDDMVAEVHLVALPPRPVLDVEHADEVGRPRPHQPVEHLERHPGRHAQLREGVGQRQQHLRHLVGGAAEPGVVDGAAVPEEAGDGELAAPPARRRRGAADAVAGGGGAFTLHLDVVARHDRLH